MVIVSTLESAYLDENIKCALIGFILAQKMQYLQFDYLKCVTYTQPIWVSFLMKIWLL